MADDKETDYLLYDGQCDACSHYVRASRLKARPGLAVLDARKESGLVADLRREGIEINETMVVRLGGKTYAGPDATRVIAELATDASPPARGLLYAIGAAPWSRALYPWLARGRWLLLRLRGRKLIP